MRLKIFFSWPTEGQIGYELDSTAGNTSSVRNMCEIVEENESRITESKIEWFM